MRQAATERGPAKTLLGIEIGGTKLQLVLGAAGGKIVLRRKFVVEPERGAVGIRAQIETAVPELARGRHLSGVGVGFGGPVDWKTGRICRSHQIEGWSEFDLSGWLAGLAGAPVRVDNDADVGALGEASHGAGARFNPVFYVTLGSGVGGGLVVDGRIYHGATPGEAEIGHVRLDRRGTIVERRCSGWAIDAKIRRLRRTAPASLLARLAARDPGGEARHLAAALKRGDAAAKRILETATGDLAFALSHVVHLFHPEVIILGGGLSKAGEPLRQSVEHHLRRFVMEAFAPGPRVLLAALGEDAVPIGALELAEFSSAL
ncbi:MAG TPA: ROK family protein [Verrucomicrobiae bacterium]